ncbi:transposase [Streptomyces sp. MMBL 11-3]|uniref:transposase n=1 Tax=Streptomyces sp. MMBL 11-3 TaxID=3382639 RepID=UPI0039B54E8B
METGTTRYEMREIVNALLHQGCTGCRWDLLQKVPGRKHGLVVDVLGLVIAVILRRLTGVTRPACSPATKRHQASTLIPPSRGMAD